MHSLEGMQPSLLGLATVLTRCRAALEDFRGLLSGTGDNDGTVNDSANVAALRFIPAKDNDDDDDDWVGYVTTALPAEASARDNLLLLLCCCLLEAGPTRESVVVTTTQFEGHIVSSSTSSAVFVFIRLVSVRSREC